MAYINTQTNQYPVSEQDIRNLNPNTSFPIPFIPPENYAWVFPAPQPVFDPMTQGVREQAPVFTAKGNWEQSWEIIELDPETIAANQAKKAEQDAKMVADKIESLWQAADKYVTGYISGVAIGILTIGVLQGKPKCMVVSNWSNQVWSEYYTRKAAITVDSPLDLDFSSFGPIPYTIPELQAEVFA